MTKANSSTSASQKMTRSATTSKEIAKNSLPYVSQLSRHDQNDHNSHCHGVDEVGPAKVREAQLRELTEIWVTLNGALSKVWEYLKRQCYCFVRVALQEAKEALKGLEQATHRPRANSRRDLVEESIRR